VSGPSGAIAAPPDARTFPAKRLAQAGMVSAGLGLLLVVPPILIHSVAVPIVLTTGALLLGALAIRGGEARLGGLALFAGAVAGVSGVLLTTTDTPTVRAIVTAGLFASTLRFATPLVLGGLGGVLSERSGVVNIAIEGMMLMGCFWGFWVATETLSWPIGLAAAMAAGGFSALIHAFFSIHLGANQIISGTAINILAAGVTSFAYRSLIGSSATPAVDRIPIVHLPLISKIPFFGDIFGDLNLMVWLMFALVVLIWIFLTRTPWGLRLRAVGEHPRAADTVGIDVYRVRYLAVVSSGMLAGMAGAFLSFGFGSSFNENMTNGRGFIALAAVVFGNWRPWGVLWAALLFGFASALGDALQTAAGVNATLVNALPYIFTLVAMVGLVGRSRPPAADGIPYTKQ
jgi:general nucleoside transport system permease protein